MSPFHALSRPALDSLASALELHRLTAPFHPTSLSGYVPAALRAEVAAELEKLVQMGMMASHITYLLRALSQERADAQAWRDRLELVWTGETVEGAESRATGIVVRELFTKARSSVLISSYALDKGHKGKEIFQTLAERMDQIPTLQVRMFLNVQRPHRSNVPESTLLREFAEQFRNEIWTGKRFPEVFHDPRSLSMEPGPKACLHAKCIIVDEELLLVTSANFTEAAHERNIEAGIIVVDRVAARALRSQFEMLVSRGALRRISGI
jgi:PLD-like domain